MYCGEGDNRKSQLRNLARVCRAIDVNKLMRPDLEIRARHFLDFLGIAVRF